jgi:hypothetical protein
MDRGRKKTAGRDYRGGGLICDAVGLEDRVVGQVPILSATRR